MERKQQLKIRQELLDAFKQLEEEWDMEPDAVRVRCAFDINLFGKEQIQSGSEDTFRLCDIEVPVTHVSHLLEVMIDVSNQAAQGVLKVIRQLMDERDQEEEEEGEEDDEQ